jgi:3-oxoacyl-[acyl-carrier protein] reductase
MVTGAGHGLGRAIALAFAALGADVYACGIEADELAQTAAAFSLSTGEGPAGTCTAVKLDVTKHEEVKRFVCSVEGAPSTTGRDGGSSGSGNSGNSGSGTGGNGIDILVNNAGGVLGQVGRSIGDVPTQSPPLTPLSLHLQVGRPIEDVSIEDWHRIFDVNATGAFVCAQAVAPGMKRKGWGRIVNISSGAGLRKSLTGIQAYCSAKHAQVGLISTPFPTPQYTQRFMRR